MLARFWDERSDYANLINKVRYLGASNGEIYPKRKLMEKSYKVPQRRVLKKFKNETLVNPISEKPKFGRGNHSKEFNWEW